MKLKVLWICHFSNLEIQKKINVRKNINEFAPWISLGVKEVQKNNEIELHIISPHRWINRTKEFKDKNVHYHFFNPGIPWYGRHWPSFFRWDLFTNFRSNRKKISKLTKLINPDIIHWHGAENGYYTSSFFDLNKIFPYFITIQGFISLGVNNKSNTDKTIKYPERKLIEIEKKILTSAKNIGVRDQIMKNEVLKYNPLINFYWHEYFINVPEFSFENTNDEKIYDIIFFSRVIKSKGIEDLIIAISIIKKSIPNIKAAIVGNSNIKYIEYLNQLADKNNCSDNIDFMGFIPTQEDIYKILKQSKIFVLPAYVGDVSGGMIESMSRKIPVVAYKTDGIPEVNNNGHYIELAEQGDVSELAKIIQNLLENPSYAEELAKAAFVYATNRWNNQTALNDIMNAYKSILGT